MFGCEQSKNKLNTSITYSEITPAKNDIFELFETTGWNEAYKLTSDDLYVALEKSWYLVSAYQQRQIVGFGRIICDGKVHALILDLIVHPEFQHKGIGSNILDKLVKKCRQHQIRDIQLFCAKDYSGFYEKRGFVKRTDDAPGMEYIHPTL